MTGLDAFFSFLSMLRRCWNCSPSRRLVSPVHIYIYNFFFYLNEIMSQSVAQSVNYSAGQLAIQPVNQLVSQSTSQSVSQSVSLSVCQLFI